MSVQVTNLSKSYGEKQILKDLNFEINEGQVVGLLGLNGAGKSTLIKILTGYISPTEGQVEIFDCPVGSYYTAFKRIIGYLAEHNLLYLDMYVLEYLRFCSAFYEVPPERIDEVIELTSIKNELSKKLKMLSKGYRQRVGLAAAILHKPKFLILDEPTSGLDFDQLVIIRQLIKTLGKTSTILLSSHIMEEIKEVCTSVLVLRKGQIILDKHPGRLEMIDLLKEMKGEVVS